MPPDRSHFDHQLIAFLEQANLPLGSKWGVQTHLVDAVAFYERVRSLGASHCCRILFILKQFSSQLSNALQTNDLMTKQRHTTHWHWVKIRFYFFEKLRLRSPPIL